MLENLARTPGLLCGLLSVCLEFLESESSDRAEFGWRSIFTGSFCCGGGGMRVRPLGLLAFMYNTWAIVGKERRAA